MLAGLLFATEEADDRPDMLAATLPFGGMTLLEYQARLLIAAGVGQIVVAVARVTPALLGAVNRAGKRGVPIDVVRSAQEATQQIHPEATVLALADGLVTAEPVIEKLAAEGGAALLVTRDGDSPAALERLDAHFFWAGVARLPAHSLGEVARMPRDYDFQSLLLRVAAQAGAEQLVLHPSWEKSGHAIERNAEALTARSSTVIASLAARRANWADRWVYANAARLLLPRLIDRGIGGWTLELGGIVLAGLGFAADWFHYLGIGSVAAVAATALFASGSSLAALRGEARRARIDEGLIAVTMAAGLLLPGWVERVASGTDMPLLLAVVAVLVALIGERASRKPRRWWGSPATYLLLLSPFALAGFVTAGLLTVSLYGFSTLTAAVEALREKA